MTNRLSTIEESELLRETKPSDSDWSILTSGRFHRHQAAQLLNLEEFDEHIGLVFVADEKRHTTLAQLGLYEGRAVALDMDTRAPLCSFPLRIVQESGAPKSFIDMFNSALDSANLGTARPELY